MIIKDEVRGSYIMVLQFADGGSLRNYLEKYFSSLTWPDKLNMAIDIAKGLICLHAEQIIHRDLAVLSLDLSSPLDCLFQSRSSPLEQLTGCPVLL